MSVVDKKLRGNAIYRQSAFMATIPNSPDQIFLIGFQHYFGQGWVILSLTYSL